MGWVLLQFYMTTPIWSVSHDDVLDWVGIISVWAAVDKPDPGYPI